MKYIEIHAEVPMKGDLVESAEDIAQLKPSLDALREAIDALGGKIVQKQRSRRDPQPVVEEPQHDHGHRVAA